MNEHHPRTELRVLDVLEVPGRGDRLGVVEVLVGQPQGGMVFFGEDVPGRWKVTELAHFSPTPATGGRRLEARLPVGFVSLESGRELRPGVHLIEVPDAREASWMAEEPAEIEPTAPAVKGE